MSHLRRIHLSMLNPMTFDVQRKDGRVEHELLATLADAHGVSDVNCISWCPREGYEDMLATAGDDCAVRVWRVQSGKPQK